MGNELDFEVVVTGLNSEMDEAIDEWMQAQAAPKSELPKLSKVERDLARKMGAKQEDYQRMVLAGQLGQMRLKSRGEALGRILKDLLPELGDGFRLDGVRSDLVHSRWVCGFESDGRVVNVAIPRDLADAALDFGTVEDLQQLRQHLVERLGPRKESKRQ
jgi:hypothetical protein